MSALWRCGAVALWRCGAEVYRICFWRGSEHGRDPRKLDVETTAPRPLFRE